MKTKFLLIILGVFSITSCQPGCIEEDEIYMKVNNQSGMDLSIHGQKSNYHSSDSSEYIYIDKFYSFKNVKEGALTDYIRYLFKDTALFYRDEECVMIHTRQHLDDTILYTPAENNILDTKSWKERNHYDYIYSIRPEDLPSEE